MFICCACLCDVVPFSLVADGATEEENAQEFDGQYRKPEYAGKYCEPEPENEYREQELDFVNGKFNPTHPLMHILS